MGFQLHFPQLVSLVGFLKHQQYLSKKSPTGPTERTPKPEYLYNSSSNLLRGPLGFGPIQFLMESRGPKDTKQLPFATRWASASYKWSYNLYKWPCN